MNRLCRYALTSLVFAFSSMSCSTVEVYQYQYDTTLDEVFVKQGADFSSYQYVMVDQISVWYPDEYAPTTENADKAQANLARAQDLFHETIGEAISDNYTLTDTPGADVLRLHVEFVDLRAARKHADVPGDLSRYEFRTRPGHITMIGELYDSVSGEQLARASDLGKQQSVGGNGVVDWQAIASDFEYWANVFGAWLANAQGQ